MLPFLCPPRISQRPPRLISTRRISQRIRGEIADEGIKAWAVMIFDFAANSQESGKEFYFSRKSMLSFWGKLIYNFAGNSQSRGNQKTISKRIRSEFDAKFASWKSAFKRAPRKILESLFRRQRRHVTYRWKSFFKRKSLNYGGLNHT